MKTEIIKTGGLTFRSDFTGRSSDPAVLLIMGAMTSGVWWPDEFCRKLAGGTECH